MLPIFYACGYGVITVRTLHVGMDDRVPYTSTYLMSRGFGVCVFLLSAKARLQELEVLKSMILNTLREPI